MTATFTVFVDESGDEGFKFGNGTSEWFVLSAVIVRSARELELVALTNGIKTRLNKLPLKKPLHFRRLKHEQKVLFADQISTAAAAPSRRGKAAPAALGYGVRVCVQGVRRIL